MKKYKVITIIIFSLFMIYVLIEVSRSSKIPEHIHSIDDKAVEQRNDDENILIMERTLQKDPANVRVMLNLTDLYIKTNRKSEAKDLIEKILEKEPSNTEALERLKSIN